MKSNRNSIKPYVIIIATCVLVFANTFGNKYALDDSLILTPSVRKGITAISEIITDTRANSNKFQLDLYRPLRQISLALDESLFGSEPGPKHMMNVIYYAAFCCLFFAFLRREFPRYKQWWLLVCVLLFAVHTLNVEVVANIKSRDIILGGICSISGLLCVQKIFERRYNYVVPALLLFILSVFAKKDAIILAILIPLMYVNRSEKPLLSNIWGAIKISIFIPVIIFISVFTLKFYNPSVKDEGPDEIRVHLGNCLNFIDDKTELFATQLWLAWVNVSHVLLPTELVYLTAYNQVEPTQFNSYKPWLGLLVLVGLLTALAWSFLKNKRLFYGIACFVALLIPYLQFFKYGPDTYADRFMFYPLLGYSIMLWSVLSYVFKVDPAQTNFSDLLKRPLPLVVVGSILLLYSGLTVARNRVWYDDWTLYSTDMPKMENNTKANYNYAGMLYENSKKSGNELQVKPEVYKHFQKSIDIFPGYATNYIGYSRIAKDYGDDSLAHSVLQKAVRKFNNNAEVLANYGFLLYNLREYNAAEVYLIQAIKMGFEPLEPLQKLFWLKMKTNQFDQAIGYADQAIAIEKISGLPYILKGKALMTVGKYDEAMQSFKAALDREPSQKKNIEPVLKTFQEGGEIEIANQLSNLLKKY